MATNGCDAAQLALLDLIYQGEAGDTDALDLLPQWFEGLQQLFSFSSAGFMPIDPVTQEFYASHVYDCRRRAVRVHRPAGPPTDWHGVRTALGRPNRVVRLSDLLAGGEATPCERDPLREPPTDCHALGMVPLLGGLPLGAFAVHRTRGEGDFDAREMGLFAWFVGHATQGIEVRSLRRSLRSVEERSLLVVTREGKIRSLTRGALQLLEALPERPALRLPAADEVCRVSRCGSEVYAASVCRVAPQALIGLQASGALLRPELIVRLQRRLRVAAGEQRPEMALLIERLDVHRVVRDEIFGLDLTPQQKRVAILLLRRYQPRQIAEILGLSPHTVRDYVKEIHRRAGVRGSTALNERLSSRPGGRSG